MAKEIRIKNNDESNERLDRFIQTNSTIGSRSQITMLIDKGNVRVNGVQKKASYKVQPGDEVVCEIPDPVATTVQPLDAPLEIVYEDEDCLVISKPSGLVMHPAAGHLEDTLVNILAFHRPDIRASLGEVRPGIVHRLDKETSGLIVVAKTPTAVEFIASQFKARTVSRKYWAIVFGTLKKKEGRIQNYLARHPANRKKFASHIRSSQGKVAITNYRVLRESKHGFSLLECKLETGRTHQIRVHMSELGHYILGDRLYGAKQGKDPTRIDWGPRIGLHAFELGFILPSGPSKLFKLDWPVPYNSLIEELPWS